MVTVCGRMAPDPAAVTPATLDLIQGWIIKQRQAPTQVTNPGLENALLNLERQIRMQIASDQATPEMGETNWIGLLQEYRAAHPISGSALQGISWTEGHQPIPGSQVSRFACHVKINEHPNPFPGVTHGLNLDGTQPSFAKKKDAKAYAAKCAVEWLRETGRMPKYGGVKFPKAPVQAKPQPPPKPPSPKAKRAPVQDSPFGDTDSDPSATHEVSLLIQQLAYPTMTYDVHFEDGFWHGRANFGNSFLLVPFEKELKHVKDVMSKSLAKEEIARDILPYLRAEKAKREEQYQKFMEGVTMNKDPAED
ncbi:hypothetical protein GGR57DRAFT_447436 [Xylariaceae sp. FL1272]|nr:hypothetical protein GGR57DRAFT_447436 [Xylariaceae sp. FL1272]